jgi:hypothetical protein
VITLKVDVFKKGEAGHCDVRGCHNNAEFGIYTGSTQYICNYHMGAAIRRIHKKESKK